jgi:hypothetical protein
MNLSEIRNSNPVFKNLSDQELADYTYNKHYSHSNRNDFNRKIGYTPTPEPKESISSQALRYGIEDPLMGFAEFGHQLINAPHNFISSKIPKQAELDLPPATDLTSKIMRGIGQYAPSLAAPEMYAEEMPALLANIGRHIEKVPKFGKFLRSALGAAESQGIYSAIQNPDEAAQSGIKAAGTTVPYSATAALIGSGNKAVRTAGRGALAALGGAGGYELGKHFGTIPGAVAGLAGAALSGFHLNPELEARRTHFPGVQGTDYENKLDAAKRLNLAYITPAEASGNPFVGANQGNVGRTEVGSKLLYKKGEERVQSEKDAINRLFNTIHNEKLNPEITSLYKQAYEYALPETTLASLKENEVFKRAERIIKNKPAFKESLKDVPENSIAYLDHVKRAMDDMINTAERQGANSEARIMKQTRETLLAEADKFTPKYKEARQMAERQITRKKLENTLNEYDIRGTDFFRRALKNDKNFDKLMHSLRNVPQAQLQLEDMRLVFRDLINPPTVRTAVGLAKGSMNKERSSAQSWMNAIKEIYTGNKYDKAAIELITNPNWADKLHAAAQATSKEKKASEIIKLLGKANASYVGVKEDKK